MLPGLRFKIMMAGSFFWTTLPWTVRLRLSADMLLYPERCRQNPPALLKNAYETELNYKESKVSQSFTPIELIQTSHVAIICLHLVVVSSMD
jgi:hypothetical protein